MMWAHLPWLSPSKRKPSQPPGGSPRIAPEQVWNRETTVIRFAWDMVRGDPRTEKHGDVTRLLSLSVTYGYWNFTIKMSNMLRIYRSFRKVGFLASFWRSWFLSFSITFRTNHQSHTSLRPAHSQQLWQPMGIFPGGQLLFASYPLVN